MIGYDDMLPSRLSTPTLSTIKQDTAKAGRPLVSRVLDAARDHQPERLPTDLIVRESCGGQALARPNHAAAARLQGPGFPAESPKIGILIHRDLTKLY